MVIDGREVLNFGGSAYLGLSAEPSIVEAGMDAVRNYGSTCQLPRHYGFGLEANLRAEKAATEFFGCEAAIYFSTGYMFGLLALGGLSDRYDVVLIDEKAHYNLIDGARGAGKPIHTFEHRSAADLGRKLEAACSRGARPAVATDGMFATQGTSPPLDEYARILAPYDGWLIVDESHSFGCLGAHGRGACEMFGVDGERVIAGGSMGKALCAHGGLATGPAEIIDALWKTPGARGAVAGTSMGAAMTEASLRFIAENPGRIAKLRENSRYLKKVLSDLGLDPAANSSPIATFEYGTAETMRTLQSALWEDGIFVIHSNYVGSGPNGAIRIAAFADHEKEDFDRLKASLGKAIEK